MFASGFVSRRSDQIAQQVAAAVADVEDQHAAAFGHQAHQRGAHAAELGVGLSAGENGLIGGTDGLFDHTSNGAARFGAFAQAAQHLFHGHGAGDLAGRGAAHAVTDDIDSVFGGVAECIFIGRAFAADVGKPRQLNSERHHRQENSPAVQFTRFSCAGLVSYAAQ